MVTPVEQHLSVKWYNGQLLPCLTKVLLLRVSQQF